MKRINFSRTSFSDFKRGLTRTFQNADIRRLLFMVRVEGESLWPHLVPGRRYVASALACPRIGDFAVFRNPRDTNRVFVKSIREISADGYVMASTVSWGSSSTDFGIVPRELVLGKILNHREGRN